jgi:hypothetical protein
MLVLRNEIFELGTAWKENFSGEGDRTIEPLCALPVRYYRWVETETEIKSGTTLVINQECKEFTVIDSVGQKSI